MTSCERAQQRRELFTNPYGKYNYYQLNADNAVIGGMLSEYAKIIDMYSPVGDVQRVEFEKYAWSFLCRFYMRDRYSIKFDIPLLTVPEISGNTFLPLLPDKHISKKLFGWRREQLEIFINDILGTENAVGSFRKAVIKWTSQKKSQ